MNLYEAKKIAEQHGFKVAKKGDEVPPWAKNKLIGEAKRVVKKAGYIAEKKGDEVPPWAKGKNLLAEALKTARRAGYRPIKKLNECGDDCCDFDGKLAGERCTCSICGTDTCDGEYTENGEFVCTDCAMEKEATLDELDDMDYVDEFGEGEPVEDKITDDEFGEDDFVEI